MIRSVFAGQQLSAWLPALNLLFFGGIFIGALVYVLSRSSKDFKHQEELPFHDGTKKE